MGNPGAHVSAIRVGDKFSREVNGTSDFSPGFATSFRPEFSHSPTLVEPSKE